MTIEHLDDYDIDFYSEVLFEEYNLGDRGVLILFVNSTKNLKILTGIDISNYLTADDLDEIITQFFAPYIKNHEYDDGNDFLVKYKSIILIVSLSLALLISYFFCLFFKSFYRTKNHSYIDYFMFGIISFANIVLVCFAYSLEPVSVFVYSAVVLYVVMSVFGDGNKIDYQDAFYQVQEQEKEKEKLKRKRKRK